MKFVITLALIMVFASMINAVCIEGQDFCTACADANNCQACGLGFVLNGQPKVCSFCSNGQHGCRQCNKILANGCINCLDGFTLDNYVCLHNCVNGEDNCRMCDKDNKLLCASCNDGYWLDASNKCGSTVCTTGCTTCASADKCDTCSAGFTRDIINQICLANCVEGRDNCKTCDNVELANCSVCNDGYWLDATTKKCGSEVCTSNCTTCASANTCTTCSSTATLNEAKTCDISTSGTILVSFFALLLIDLMI